MIGVNDLRVNDPDDLRSEKCTRLKRYYKVKGLHTSILGLAEDSANSVVSAFNIDELLLEHKCIYVTFSQSSSKNRLVEKR